jgi:hypothetical protein
LELIVFNRHPPPSEHWASRTPGWIDAADLGTDQRLFQIINNRYKEPLYKPAKDGGRLTNSPEGVMRELKWRVTMPDNNYAAGELPFFCEDLTPREWRVSGDNLGNTSSELMKMTGSNDTPF